MLNHDHVNPDGTESAPSRTPAQVHEDAQRERLIALLSWWSGWCTDHDHIEPELAKLGGLLLDAKHRIALDRALSVSADIAALSGSTDIPESTPGMTFLSTEPS